ncbi:MAG TPA: glutathione S-transferase family protein [Candidatus Nanopelagicales bacterium]|nr:glutathione S-transferase family protein [Candidatus Nanopelagicales bacterium]
MTTPRLLTIPFSHYCEKARWALQHAGVAFAEEGHLPPFHAAGVRRAGGKRSVPVLVTDEGVINDSSEILRYADRKAPEGRKLFGDSEAERREIEALEDLCDEDLGPHARRWIYFHILPVREVMAQLTGQGEPGWERVAFTAGLPVIRLLMRRAMRIDAEGAARSRSKIDQVFDRIAERLSDGRPFLVGARPSAADFTFASLAAPVLAPPGYGARLPSDEDMPPEAAAGLRAYREHPAGKWAMRFYEEHRASPTQRAQRTAKEG